MEKIENNNIVWVSLLLLASVTGALVLSFSEFRLFSIAFGYAIMVVLCKWLKLTPTELGLDRKNIGKGLRLGGLLAIGIFLLMGLIFAIKSEAFRDSRYNQSFGHMVLSIFILLPLTTVIFEELWFRGITLGILSRKLSANHAALVSALAFGLWHALSARSFQFSGLAISRPIVICFVIVVTGFAGWIFVRLRQASGSLITPILVHWAINASGIMLAYLAWK